MIHMSNTYAQGKIAALTAFEPRLCTAPLECSWPKLKDLIVKLAEEMVAAVAMEEVKLQDRGEEVEAALQEMSTVLEKCADTLTMNEEPSTELSSLKPDTVADDEKFNAVSVFTKNGLELVEAVVAWKNAMLHPESSCGMKGVKTAMGTYLLWIIAPVPLIQGLVLNLFLPFRPKLWDLPSFLSSVKWTTGFVALFCMTVFWPA